MRVLDPGMSLDAYRSFTRWAYVIVVLFFGLYAVVVAALTAQSAGWGVAATAAVTALTAVAVSSWPRRSPFRLLEISAVVAAVGWMATVWTGASTVLGFVFFLPLAYGIATRRPWWPWASAAVVVLLTAVSAAAISGRIEDGRWLPGLTMAVFFVCAQVFVFLSVEVGWILFARMDAHRANENELSITQERLRFADELHDVQGHTLLAIKLKAELARRSLDRAPDVARTELAEIERLVAEASAQTRQIANGYRPVALATELANAERLLAAAGIVVRIEPPSSETDEWERLFATAVREGISNILRHADAKNVSIRFTGDSVTVVNDGARPEAPDAAGGHGLVSLRDRFEQQHGSISWVRDDSTFTLTASRAPNGGRR